MRVAECKAKRARGTRDRAFDMTTIPSLRCRRNAALCEKRVLTFRPFHLPAYIPHHHRLFIRIKWEGILRLNAITFIPVKLHSFTNFPLVITWFREFIAKLQKNK